MESESERSKRAFEASMEECSAPRLPRNGNRLKHTDLKSRFATVVWKWAQDCIDDEVGVDNGVMMLALDIIACLETNSRPNETNMIDKALEASHECVEVPTDLVEAARIQDSAENVAPSPHPKEICDLEVYMFLSALYLAYKLVHTHDNDNGKVCAMAKTIFKELPHEYYYAFENYMLRKVDLDVLRMTNNKNYQELHLFAKKVLRLPMYETQVRTLELLLNAIEEIPRIMTNPDWAMLERFDSAALVIVTQLGEHPDDDKMAEVLKQLRAYVPNTEPEPCPLMRQQTRLMVSILQRAADAIEELKGELPADAIEELKEELPVDKRDDKSPASPGATHLQLPEAIDYYKDDYKKQEEPLEWDDCNSPSYSPTTEDIAKARDRPEPFDRDKGLKKLLQLQKDEMMQRANWDQADYANEYLRKKRAEGLGSKQAYVARECLRRRHFEDHQRERERRSQEEAQRNEERERLRERKRKSKNSRARPCVKRKLDS